jgi:hypothetical protein
VAELLALGDDPPRLAAAKAVIADEEASPEKLKSAVNAAVIRISLVLSDPETAQALMEQVPESARPSVEKARDIVKENLAGIEKHPAIVRLMKTELAKRTGHREDLKNRIVRVKWEPLWQDNKNKLTPTARVSFLDEQDELVLDSTLDWDDLAFLMRSCARILVRLGQKSEPIAKAGLLDLSDAERLRTRIAETRSSLDELVSIASILGVDLSKSAASQAADDPSEPEDSQ